MRDHSRSRSTYRAGILALAAAAFLASSVPASRSRAAGGTSPIPARPGKFVWFDLLTYDTAAAKSFYGGLFGWTFEVVKGHEPRYEVIRAGGEGIGGVVDMSLRKEQVAESTWLGYVSVPDVDAAAAVMRAKGGRVLREPFDVAGRARAAVVTDPDGALLGLIRIVRGDPPDRTDSPLDRFFWIEYMARDPETSTALFHDVLGLDAERIDGGAANVGYLALKREGVPRAGLYALPRKEIRPNWLPYVRVADAAAAAEKAKALGGRVVVAPRADLRNGTLAIVTDPTGAAVALQKWPIEDSPGGKGGGAR